jgi:tRNA pseudouridine38-40 synthase
MARYFIEVAYKGTAYAGFQIQQNANTIQTEVEKALHVYYRHVFELTGSSRTDAGVHAQQNYFHFDTDIVIDNETAEKALYHLNAILPQDIVVKSLQHVANDVHCRFDAIGRSYQYSIYQSKNPFIDDTAYYFPYSLNIDLLNEAAVILLEYTNFQSFSKKNTQVFTYECTLTKSQWTLQSDILLYEVTGNRFLRGMVRGLVGTMLHVGRGKFTIGKFRSIIESKNTTDTDFSTPAKGLVLKEVKFKDIMSNI